jgi:hypothetical protein
MFINRLSLRDSSIRRAYQFSKTHNKSYLNPVASASTDSSANPDANPDASPTFDATVDLLDGVDADADEFLDDLDFDLYTTSDINNPTLPTQSKDLSVGPSDSVSQALPLTTPRPYISSRSWVYKHFSVVALNGRQYTLSHTSKLHTDKRRSCNYCGFNVLDSRRHRTSGLAVHLKKHGITKNQGPRCTTSIAELVIKPPLSKKPKLSPEESIV